MQRATDHNILCDSLDFFLAGADLGLQRGVDYLKGNTSEDMQLALSKWFQEQQKAAFTERKKLKWIKPLAEIQPDPGVDIDSLVDLLAVCRNAHSGGGSGVYFMGCLDLVKIGYSYNGKYRLSCIQTLAPYPVTLLAGACGDQLLERYLHMSFADFRHNGEWFKRNPLLDALIWCLQYLSVNQWNTRH